MIKMLIPTNTYSDKPSNLYILYLQHFNILFDD